MAKTKTLNDLMGGIGSHLEAEAKRAVRDERRERRAANRDTASGYDRDVIAWFRDKQGRPIPITAPSGGRMLRTGRRNGTMQDEKTGKIYKKDGTKVENVTLQDSLSGVQKTYPSDKLPDDVDYTPQPALKEVEGKSKDAVDAADGGERLITRGGNVFSVKKGEKWKWLGLDAKTASKPDAATAQKVAQKTAEIKEDSKIASGALDLINKDLSSDRQRLREVEKKLNDYTLDDVTRARLSTEKKEAESAIQVKVERQAAAELDVARAQAEVKSWAEEKKKIIRDSVASQQEKLFDPSKLPNTGRLPDASETTQGVVAKVAEDEPRDAKPIVIQYPGLAKMLEERGETQDPPSGEGHVENPVLTASFVNQWTKTMQAARAGAVGADQLTKSSTLTDLTMPTVDGGYVVPYDLPKAVVDATGYKQANPEWMSEESKERQKTASLSGFDSIQAPPGYELSGGVIYAPPNEPDKFVGITTIPSSKDEPVAVGKFKFDDNGVGYIELDPDLKISPSFASGQYYRGMPEYQGKPKGFTEELRKQASGTTDGTTLKNITTPTGESDWEAISEAAWRGRRWDAIKLRDTLDQWRNANDYERSALIAQLDPRQAGLKDADRKLDTGWLFRQGYLSAQDARMFDKLAHGTEPGYSDMPKAFDAWVGTSASKPAQEFRDIAQKKGETSFWLAAGARLLEQLPAGRLASSVLDLEKDRASSVALYGAKEAFVAEYFQEANRKVDFDMPAFVAARDKLTGDEGYVGWAQNALNNVLQNAIGSTGGMLTEAVKIEADGVARIFGKRVLTDDELQIIGGQTQSAIQNLSRAMEDRKPDSLGETFLMAMPGAYLWNLGGARDKMWNGKVGGRVKEKVDELYSYVNSGNTTEEGFKSRAIQLQKDLDEYHGDKMVSGVVEWVVGMDGSTRLDFENDFTNKKSAMFENLTAYQQTGAKSYWSAFEAAALNSSHDQYVQRLATDYASANGLIAESSMFGPLVLGFRSGMVAPFTETLVEVGSDVISLGGAKLLTLGRYLRGAERAGLLANRIGRELGKFDELAIAWERLGKTESVLGKELTAFQKGLNKTVDFGKQWALSGTTEGFEEVVGAFGESGATLGDAIAQGIGGAIGGIGLSAVHLPLGAAMAQVPIALHRRAQEKALKNFVRDYNIQNAESPITLKQARSAQNYQDVAAVRQIKEAMSNIVAENQKLNNEAKTLPVMLAGEDGATLVNPRIKEIVAAQGKLAKGMAFLAPLLDKIQQSSLNAVREIEGLPEEQQALVGAVVAHFSGGVLTNDGLRALYDSGAYEAHGKLILPDSLMTSVADIAPRIGANYLNRSEEDQIVEAQLAAQPTSLPPALPAAGEASVPITSQDKRSASSEQAGNEKNVGSMPPENKIVGNAPPSLSNIWRATIAYTPKGVGERVESEITVKARTEAEAQKKVSAKVKAIYRIAEGPVNVGEVLNMADSQGPVSLPPNEQQTTAPSESHEANQDTQAEPVPENKAFIPAGDTGQWTPEAIRGALKQAAAVFGYKIVDTGIDIGVVDRYGKSVKLGTQLYDKLVPGSEIGHWMDNVGNSQFAADIAEKISHPGLHRVWFGHDFATNLGGIIDKFGKSAIPDYIGQLLKDTLTKSGIPFPGVELLVRAGAVSERVATDWLSVNIGEVFGGGVSFFGTYRLYQAAKKNKLTRPKVIFATIGVGLKITGGVMTAQPFLIISGIADAAILVTHVDGIKNAFKKAMEVDEKADASIVNLDANRHGDAAGRHDGAAPPIVAGKASADSRASQIESGGKGKDSVSDVGGRKTKRGKGRLPYKALGAKEASVGTNKARKSVRRANSKDVDRETKLLGSALERLAQRLGLPKGALGEVQIVSGDVRTAVYFEDGAIVVKVNSADLLDQAKILEDEDGGDGVEFLKSLFNEELVHVADVLSVRELWLKEGKPGSLEDYWKSFRADTLKRIEVEINNDGTDGEAIARALVEAAANYDAAGRDSSAQFIENLEGENFVEKARSLIAGLRGGDVKLSGLSDSYVLGAEFLRAVIQARRRGDLTETGYRRVVGKLLEWMRGLVKILRDVFEISPTVATEVERIERVLDVADGLKKELDEKADEATADQKEIKQTGKSVVPVISQGSAAKDSSGIAGAKREAKQGVETIRERGKGQGTGMTRAAVAAEVEKTFGIKESEAFRVVSGEAGIAEGAMEDAVRDFENDLTRPQQERLRRVAAKQFSDVERDNAEALRAHDEEGKPLLAPNGKPSKLTRRQWVQVRTPLFKRWFGDWENPSVNPDSVSKVVDENGEPMEVYHGTSATFDVFDMSYLNSRDEGPGFYFTTSEDIASGYVNRTGDDGRLVNAFLSLKKPMAYDAKPLKGEDLRRLIRRIAEIEAAANKNGIQDGFLSNFAEDAPSAVREATSLLAADETAVDQISGIIGAGVDPKHVLSAMAEVTGYDGIVASGFSNVGDASNSIFVAFTSNQIKSSTANEGMFSGGENIRYSLDGAASLVPDFYSVLGRVIERKMPNSASAAQVLAIIDPARGSGVKEEEIKWSGVRGAIERLAKENNGHVPKAALLGYLREEGSVRFNEVPFSVDNEASDLKEAYFNDEDEHFDDEDEHFDDISSSWEELMNHPLYSLWQLPGGDDYRETVLAYPQNEEGANSQASYTSSHFKNVRDYVAHMRTNERKDSEGARGVFIEEIQSDRHQAGRKEGYRDTEEGAAFFEMFGEIAGVPDAPFRKDWPLQMFKRALRDAVGDGMEWVGWTSGAMQVGRYDLNKNVDFVDWIKDGDGVSLTLLRDDFDITDALGLNKRIKIDDLANIIGKDAAKKIEDGASRGRLEGEDLRVGGSGMKSFYDNILPKEIGKYVKQWGGKVEEGTLPESARPLEFEGPLTFWRVAITPEMQRSIKEGGQVLFSRNLLNWEGRSVFDQAGNLLRIELNADNLNTPEDVRRVLEHELGHATTEAGGLQGEIDRITEAEREQIADDMDRLGYDATDAKEADARAVDALREAWKDRGWFQKIVAPIYDLAKKMGLKLSDEKLRLLAERAAVRAVAAEARKLAGRGEQERPEAGNNQVDKEAVNDYFKNNGTPKDRIHEEGERVLRFLQFNTGSGVGETRGVSSKTAEKAAGTGELSQGELFSQFGEAAAGKISDEAVNVSPAGRAGGGVENDDLVKGLKGSWSSLAAEINNKGRASSIFADLVSGRIPDWDITGTKIQSPADVLSVMFPIRSPYFESLKVMVLDGNDNVAFSQIVHVGSVNESIANPKSIFGVLARWREKTKKDYNRIIISHNHPSGDPSPSPADNRVQRGLAKVGLAAGWQVVDHVITNGETYFSFKESDPGSVNSFEPDNYSPENDDGIEPIARDKISGGKADWEVVKRSDIKILGDGGKVDEVARFLRSGNPDAVHIFYLNTRLGLIGVERISRDDFYNIEKFARILMSGIAREGGFGFALDVGSGGLTPEIKKHLKLISELSENSSIRFVDAVSGGSRSSDANVSYESAFDKGLLEEGSLYGVVKEAGLLDYSVNQVQGEFNFDEVKSDRSIELINDNLGLAHYFANKYANIPNTDFDDRLQEARMGLILAAGSFDPARGVPFGAYASRVIKNRLNALFVSNKRIASNESIELDAPIGGEDGGTDLKNNLRAPESSSISPEDLAVIADAVQKLPARPRRVWQGLAEGRSLRDIGAEEGLSQEGVRKIANATRNTLRAELGRRGIKSVDDIFPDGRDAFPERRRGAFTETEDENAETTTVAAARRTREAVDNEKAHIDLEAQYGRDVRAFSKRGGASGRTLALDNIFPDAKEFYASVFRGRYDKLDFYAPGVKEIILDHRRNEALAVASVNGVMRQMRDDITKAFGYPKFWDKNKKRLQSFLDELLPTAARLEVGELDDDGNFIFKDFDMRSGTVEASKVRALNLNKGDDIVTDRGTFKLGDEVKEGRFLLLRNIPAAVQREIYDEFHAKYPESAHYLDRWIMPNMQEVGYSAPDGTLHIDFNRHSLRQAFNEWPAELRSLYGLEPFKDVPYVQGYTPDVAEAKTLANLIGSLTTLFKSGSRKFKSGDLRESGNVKNLFDGFSVRALEAHREKLRVELRARIIEKAVKPLALIPKDRREDFVPLDQVFFRLYEAAKIGKRLDPDSFPGSSASFSAKNDKAMAKIFGDSYRLRGRQLMVHRAVSQELMFGMARQMSNNALTRILSGLLERYNAGLLSLPFSAITNWVSNEIIKTVRLGNRFNNAVLNLVIGETRSAKIAAFEFGFLLRGVITDRFPQWQKERIGSIVPRELFEDQTGLEAIDIDPAVSITQQIGRLNLGAALLQAYGYGEIDLRAKQQMAYASYRAHAEVAWREALKRKDIDKSFDKRTWLNDWVKSQPNDFHRDVYLTTVLYLMDYQNVPALIDPQQSNTTLGQILKRGLLPFAKWPYNMAKQFKRFTFDSAIDVLFAGHTKEQRINGMANLMTMGGLAAVGAAVSMADFGGDDEPIIGTGIDELGNKITDGYKTKNRLNISRLMRIVFAHGLLRDVDFVDTGASDAAKDLYWRYRNYPYIKESLLMGLVLTGRTAKANSLLTEVSDEYLTFGIISKLLLPSSYDSQKSLSWRGAEAGLDLTTSGALPVPWRQLFVGLADPVVRLNKKNDAIGYVGGFSDSLKFNIPFASKTLPARGQRNPTSLALFSTQDWFNKKRKEIERSNLPSEKKSSEIRKAAVQAERMHMDEREQVGVFRAAGLPVGKIDAAKRSSIPIARRIEALKKLGLNNDEITLTKEGKVVVPDPASVGHRPRGLQLLRAFGGLNIIPVANKNKDEN